MDINMTSIGNRIKNRRKELSLTQTDIYNICGVASGAVSQKENGTRTPSILNFYTLAQALQCNMEWLVTGASTNSENFTIYEKEEKLLQNLRLLPERDQEEIQELVEFKLHKKGKDAVKSSKLIDTNKNDLVS